MLINDISYSERIQLMKENLGIKFEQESKKIIKDCKVLKGEKAKEEFNMELDTLTFEMEELYPLTYEEFKEEFPKIIELISTVKGSVVTNAVKRGIVIDGLSLRSNVDSVIERIEKNITDEVKKEEAIKIREEVFEETQRMKDQFDIEWNKDLFWKCWNIKEGEVRWDYLVKQKGEKNAQKRINKIREVGGIEFVKELQNEIYGE